MMNPQARLQLSQDQRISYQRKTQCHGLQPLLPLQNQSPW